MEAIEVVARQQLELAAAVATSRAEKALEAIRLGLERRGLVIGNDPDDVAAAVLTATVDSIDVTIELPADGTFSIHQPGGLGGFVSYDVSGGKVIASEVTVHCATVGTLVVTDEMSVEVVKSGRQPTVIVRRIHKDRALDDNADEYVWELWVDDFGADWDGRRPPSELTFAELRITGGRGPPSLVAGSPASMAES